MLSQLTEGLAALGRRFAARAVEDRSKVAARQTDTEPPLPALRPASSEDPETLANREGHFTFNRLAPTLTASGGEQLRIIAADRFPPVIADDGSRDLTPRPQACRSGGGRNGPAAADDVCRTVWGSRVRVRL